MLRIGSEGARDAFPSEVFEHLFSSFEAAFLAAEGKGAVDCPECGKAADLTSTIRARCPQCSEEFDLDDADSEIFVERMDSRLYGFRSLGFFSESLLKAMACLAVFVDDQSNVSLTHNGRAAKNQLASKGGSCHHASPIFSMAPGGIVSDACCSGGGGTPFGRVSEGVVLAVRRLQLMDILEKRFAVSGPLGRYHPNYDGMGACEACGSITKGLVNSRKRREEAEQVIKYIRHYGIRKRKSACIGAVR
jgi:hypothetical protein